MVHPAVGAFASPCEVGVKRLDTVLASGCSRHFQRHPSLTVLMGATVGTFPRGCVDSVVLGGNQKTLYDSLPRFSQHGIRDSPTKFPIKFPN